MASFVFKDCMCTWSLVFRGGKLMYVFQSDKTEQRRLEQYFEYYSTLNESPVLEAWYANLIYVRSSSILTGEGANLIISQLSQPTVTSSISRNLKKMNSKKRWWQLIWSRRWKGENWSYLKWRIVIFRGCFRPNYQGKLHSSFPTKSSSFYHCLQPRWIIQTTSDVEYL